MPDVVVGGRKMSWDNMSFLVGGKPMLWAMI